jgi:hypothetical protein
MTTLPLAPVASSPDDLRAWLRAHPDHVIDLPDDWPEARIAALYDAHMAADAPIEDVLHLIGAHPHAPVRALRELARGRWRSVHLGLATNPRLPTDCLDRLARSNARAMVLEHVAWNPSTPIAALEHLRDHARARVVRDAAARALQRRAER